MYIENCSWVTVKKTVLYKKILYFELPESSQVTIRHIKRVSKRKITHKSNKDEIRKKQQYLLRPYFFSDPREETNKRFSGLYILNWREVYLLRKNSSHTLTDTKVGVPVRCGMCMTNPSFLFFVVVSG